MNQTRSVADARFKKVIALAWLGLGGGGGGANADVPLSHFKWIDGSSTSNATPDGAIAAPFKTIGAFVTSLGAGSALENSINQVGIVTPKSAIAGYTENIVIPAYRNTELRALNFNQLVTGNVTCANVAGGGAIAPTSGTSSLLLHNLAFTGNVTITDDGTVLMSLVLSGDELPALGTVGNVDVSGCTACTLVAVDTMSVLGNIASTANATGAAVQLGNGSVVGTIVARNVSALSASIQGNITVATTALGGFATFRGCTFGGQTITGGLGTVITFDGASYRSFQETQGVIAGAGVIVLVIGGYDAGSVEGANLTNADVSVSIDGAGATAGFTAGGNHYTLPSGTLGAAHVVTLLLGGQLKTGDTMLITRGDVSGAPSAFTYTVHNSIGGVLGVLPVSQRGFVKARYSGAEWVMVECGAGVT
jgi:hypothetical protein